MGVHVHPQSDLGPVLRSKAELRPLVMEAQQLVLILIDETGPRGDLMRANRTLKRLQAIVGPPGEADHLEQGMAPLLPTPDQGAK